MVKIAIVKALLWLIFGIEACALLTAAYVGVTTLFNYIF